MKHILRRSIFGALWAIVILFAVVLFLNPHSRNLGALILACVSPVVVLFLPRRHRTWVGIMLLSLNFSVLVGTYVKFCRRQNDITRGHNESSAIYSLRTLWSAEEIFKAAILKDEDRDRIGEYGTLRELAGLDSATGNDAPVDPPFIDRQLGEGAKSGYSFSLHLGTENHSGYTGPDENEAEFWAVAWPQAYGRSGRRTFCVDQSGDIFGTDNGGLHAPHPRLDREAKWSLVGDYTLPKIAKKTREKLLEAVSKCQPLPDERVGDLIDRIEGDEEIDLSLVYQALFGPQTYLRACAARYLGTHGDETSIPFLIKALEDDSSHVGIQYRDAGMLTTRYWANDSLRKLTGRDDGFKWDDPEEKRDEAISRWRTWYLEGR